MPLIYTISTLNGFEAIRVSVEQVEGCCFGTCCVLGIISQLEVT